MLFSREKLLTDIEEKLKSLALENATEDQIMLALKTASIRPLRVIWECMINGEASTELLTEKYGYNQPPRAARDVRELGFNLETFSGRTSDGRRMAIYKLSELKNFQRKSARKAFSKNEKDLLVEKYGNTCYFCSQKLLSNELQIDHRVPFEVAGNSEHDSGNTDALILLCASCNRSKSWSCEQCSNFKHKEIAACKSCYWCDPNEYSHVRMKKRLVINIVFDEKQLNIDSFSKFSKSDIEQIVLRSLTKYQ